MPGPRVSAGVPAVLTDGKTPFLAQPPFPGSHSTGRRLALAKWLIAPENPLTARVMVNRMWARHFGAGIVKSLGNFGRTGTPPTNPELLDWLATEFVQQGWNIKAMHRLMMTSSTYRQVSTVTPAHQIAEPAGAPPVLRPGTLDLRGPHQRRFADPPSHSRLFETHRL